MKKDISSLVAEMKNMQRQLDSQGENTGTQKADQITSYAQVTKAGVSSHKNVVDGVSEDIEQNDD